jgi:hypothetical protein
VVADCSIKEETGERGWVPAWFVGKLTGGGDAQIPPLPSGANGGTGGSEAPPPYQKGKEENGEKKDKDE